jgi:hypothetical protein
MLKKYAIEYSLQLRKHSQPERHQYATDDPVACEEFLQHLLERGLGLHAIRRDGADLPKADFDRMVRVAASGAASRMICASLNIKVEEERFRFGFAA